LARTADIGWFAARQLLGWLSAITAVDRHRTIRHQASPILPSYGPTQIPETRPAAFLIAVDRFADIQRLGLVVSAYANQQLFELQPL
jgi:hypothetical protein